MPEQQEILRFLEPLLRPKASPSLITGPVPVSLLPRETKQGRPNVSRETSGPSGQTLNRYEDKVRRSELPAPEAFDFAAGNYFSVLSRADDEAFSIPLKLASVKVASRRKIPKRRQVAALQNYGVL